MHKDKKINIKITDSPKNTYENISQQTAFLTELVRKQTSVAVYLNNGVKLQGCIISFDEYAIMLRSTSSQMIYKRAISSILPTSTLT